jgi:hypothetical protein
MLKTATANRTATLPYLYSWTAISLDVTLTTANTAPVQLPGLAGCQYLNLCTGGVLNTPITFTWQLLLVDRSLMVANVPQVIRAIVFTTVSTARRQDGVGTAGIFLHDDKIIDIGGVGANDAEEKTWVLALAGLGGDSGAYLIAFSPARLIGNP